VSECIKHFVELCKNNNNRVIILGVVNFPNINWDRHSGQDLDGVDFLKCEQESFLNQYVEGPTRKGVVLDLILGNEAGQVVEVVVGEHFSDSDHNMVQFKLVMDKEIDKLQKKYFGLGKSGF